MIQILIQIKLNIDPNKISNILIQTKLFLNLYLLNV